ncbi:MAG: OmpH family outer membrane protein [Elusimicrobia bacterium]|nr:OmpH family outer membrane protein [Elusimicrobiota bacterium]
MIIKSSFVPSVLLVLAIGSSSGMAVDISLDPAGGTSAVNGQSPAVSIGYVDMDAVFAQHPMTKRLKEEFLAEVDKRKREIGTLQAAADALHQVIISSQTDINQEKSAVALMRATVGANAAGSGTVVVSTAVPAQQPPLTLGVSTQPVTSAETIAAKEKIIKDNETTVAAIQQDYEKQIQDISKRIKQNKEDLIKLEEKNTAAVLSDLYAIVQKMADAEGMGVIFDKNSMLCGQTCKDMTPKVLERLKGR